ncbi:alpha/beta hydrolase family protein [Sphingomonas sp. 35-24ZXX]|uniref:alpha/beta hydrolase family protein n=1 Tax=Sphingomonas sp. 35-24ZXX TaxID=1545915 RepID=UPI000691313E|nr:S9 family peptidase [Sphingomonas sp. 35-24ZXX]
MRFSIRVAALTAVLLGAAAPAGLVAQEQQAPQTADMAQQFGALEMVKDASLSPDGKRLVYLSPTRGQGVAVMVADLFPTPQTPRGVFRVDGEPERIESCHWSGNDRLVCSLIASVMVEGRALYASRMIAVDAAGGEVKVLGVRKSGSGMRLGVALNGGNVIDWNPSEDGHVLMVRDYIPQEGIASSGAGTLITQKKAGIGVDLVDTRTLRSRTVEQPDLEASEFISDGFGRVRIKGAVSSREGAEIGLRRYYYRKADSKAWLPLSTVDKDRQGFDPYAVDPALNIVYGLNRVDGRLAAFKRSLDGNDTETLVFAHPQVDVSGFARIGRRGRVIGVRYATDASKIHYIDADVQKMVDQLGKAIPHLPIIQVVESSEDERKMLIWAGSDTNAGRLFLFDRDAKTLGNLLALRPGLEQVALGKMQSISYPARDGTAIPGYLTLPPGKADVAGLPVIVMPHGGPESRDYWRFDWLSQFYAQQGYAVLQPNFRGSSGYGKGWLQRNAFQDWQTAIADINDGAHWLAKQGADAKRMAIVGWSYGGYAALQSNVLEPDLFKAVVAIAPVTDLALLRSDSYGWSDYVALRNYLGEGKHIKEGSPAQNAAAFKAPVLMFHGDLDRNVDIGHTRLMDAKLKDAGRRTELHVYKNRDHYLEDGDIRAEMLSTSAAFIAKAFAGL